MSHPRHWSLGAKLALVGMPFLLLGLIAIALTLWVSWQLDGGAAAVNEAGRMRMQAYRLSLAAGTGDVAAIPALTAEFERTLALLRDGDLERPLFVPWDDEVRQRFAVVEKAWARFSPRRAERGSSGGLRDDTAAFAGAIDSLVTGIERHMTRWTALLHLLQMAIMAFAVIGAAALLYMGYLFVLEPVGRLKEATARIQGGDLDARVDRVTTDEFGSLADCFNGMAERVQSMYRHLEARVAEKTRELEEKRERLQALYDVTTLVTEATSLKSLADGFTERVRRLARADGIALRWSDEGNRRFLLLASAGLPTAMSEAEQCVHADECHCGALPAPYAVRVLPVAQMQATGMAHCANAGFATVASVPIRLHDRLMGEVSLFFHASVALSPAERSLLEALSAHLAGAMENLRLNALEKEAAVAHERMFLARELHDSIAQSLAFLKIQVQLLRDSLATSDGPGARQALAEIDTGVRECYGDVRELLVHFRTRSNVEDIEPALATTLRKFEHQSGVPAALHVQGHGMPLAPDVQTQVLHIVQEALSNVRKHAGATRVDLAVRQQPQWRFEVRDDGAGFVPKPARDDDTHVGLRIMAERAERIGAALLVTSAPGCGTSIVLTLAASAPAIAPAALAADTVH
jgi:two-component system nitrate/nitrite sensor histidine kinase NarX